MYDSYTRKLDVVQGGGRHIFGNPINGWWHISTELTSKVKILSFSKYTFHWGIGVWVLLNRYKSKMVFFFLLLDFKAKMSVTLCAHRFEIILSVEFALRIKRQRRKLKPVTFTGNAKCTTNRGKKKSPVSNAWTNKTM